MSVTPAADRRAALTGSRIRERRMALGRRQGDLAREVGISASYLNLIEHNKRRIGGKLLIDIARALGLEPGALSEGAEASVFETLQAAAAAQSGPAARPETDRIDAFVGRFPGWARTIAGQHRRIAALEALTDALRDRLSHDPVLAEAMHEVLSTVAAIRSTAAILAEDDGLDPQWRARFHRNLHEEAERLSARATGLIQHFEPGPGGGPAAVSTPEETVEALFDIAGHHFPEIEAAGAEGIAPVLSRTEGMEDGPTRALAVAALTDYAADAARLPLADFAGRAAEAGFEPEALWPLAPGDPALVLRRLASLPPETGVPDFGLAVVDAAGAVLRRRRLAGFTVPRFAPGCPLWPIYRAFGRPLMPERAGIEMPDGGRFATWSVSQPGPPSAGPPAMRATMLMRDAGSGEGRAEPVGPGCALCSREACTARRRPNLAG
ncbi:DUF2083 domain-containing protein [Rhodobacterales bacterium HKCCE2091]|nr:DUF2083 domain-containing protein [Rhodobacterales bacterium HKCCE2091]